MMGLEIHNCNEMERDFLIRYANAAKSKSCVVVSREDAEVSHCGSRAEHSAV